MAKRRRRAPVPRCWLAKAGMTIAAALSILDAQDKHQASNPFTTTNPFQDFGDWMEAKEPGWKAREAARRSEKEAKRLARCKELLEEYGSEDAVFAPTETEAALRDALAHLADPDNLIYPYRGFSFCKGPTLDMWQAMRAAVRVPDTVAEAWAAYQAHEARTDARCAFCPDYTSWEWEEAWRSGLEYLLNHLRSPTAEGIAARLAWLEHRANQDMAPDPEQERVLVASLQADFSAFVQSGQVTPQRPADRRAAVLDLLRAGHCLSDREIARRVGVSPQTVGNIRKRHATQEAAA